MKTAIGFLWIGIVLTFGLFTIGVAFLGLQQYVPFFGVVLIFAAALFFRFTLPISVCAFLGAWQVLNWPWYFAFLFAAPGIALMIPGILATLVGALLPQRR